MNITYRFALAAWLLAAPAGSGMAGAPAPSIKVSLNNNPKAAASWHSPMSADRVDVDNIPGVMISGRNFRDGRARLEVYFAGNAAAKGEVTVASGTFSALLPLGAPLPEPRALEIRVGGAFKQSVQVSLRRLRGTIRRKDGAPAPFPLVTNGLFRSSAFYVTAIGNKEGKFEIFLPENIRSVTIYDNNSSRSQLECRSYPADQKSGQGVEICMEPHLAYTP